MRTRPERGNDEPNMREYSRIFGEKPLASEADRLAEALRELGESLRKLREALKAVREALL